MKQILLFGILAISLKFQWIGAQTLKIVEDPLGNQITINKDSSFVYNSFGNLMTYTINQEDETRNILIFNGDTSFWLFNQGFDKNLTYTSFTRTEIDGFPGKKVWFRIGNIWYETKGNPQTTVIFNDNEDVSKPYQYLQLFNFFTGDLGIEVVEKNTGDTLVLIYDDDNEIFEVFKDEFGNNIKVIQVAERFGFSYTKDFVGAQFNPITQNWDPIGIYSWSPTYLRKILELGTREKYDLKFVYKDYTVYQYIIDLVSPTVTTVYEYNTSTQEFDNVTSSVINGYEVVDAYNLPLVSYDADLNGYASFTESLWKCKSIPVGSPRYFVRSVFANDAEIFDLRNDQNAYFMYESISDDSIYYYNYGETTKGLTRYSTLDQGKIKDESSIQFDPDYKIRGWKGKMYFGRYDATVGKIVAAFKDFYDDNNYRYLESSLGEKAISPIDFSFLKDKVFIHSRTAEGIKVVYYDTMSTVATNELLNRTFQLVLSPNPSTGIINAIFPDEDIDLIRGTSYVITDLHGTPVLRGLFQDNTAKIGVSVLPSGMYYLTVTIGQRLITQTFTIIE